MKAIHWMQFDFNQALKDELPGVHPDFQPTQSRPAVTQEILEEERKRSAEERAVLRGMSRKYTPLGLERPKWPWVE